MRKLTRFSVVLTACFAMGLATGCDDDGGEAKTDTTDDIGTDTPDEDTTGGDTVEGDTADDSTTTPDEGPDATEDVEPVDPCDPNPCTTPPQAVCTNTTTLVTYAAEGTCTANGANASCEYQATTTTCEGETPVCFQGECTAQQEIPTEFSAQASWISSLAIAGIPPAGGGDALPACCFDFTGDDTPDNALGKLVGQIGGFLGGDDLDVNGLLLEAIQDGTVNILLEQVDLDDTDPTNDTEFVVNGYYGANANPSGDPLADYNANLGGDGDFLVSPSSFAPNGQPLISFGGASTVGGAFEAGPSPFTLSFPLGEISLTVTVSGTQIAGTAAVGPNGAGLEITEGKLGGYVHIEDLISALNGYADSNCGCLGLPGPLVNYTNESTFSCNKPSNNTCTSDDGFCNELNQYCSIALPVIKSVLDVDSGGLPAKDSLSVGVWFEATSANLVGLETEE